MYHLLVTEMNELTAEIRHQEYVKGIVKRDMDNLINAIYRRNLAKDFWDEEVEEVQNFQFN